MICLMYHHVLPIRTEHSVSPQQLENHIITLKKKGYNFVSTHSLRNEKNSISLTFDDGWLDNFLFAVPILIKHNIPATFFIVTSWPNNGQIRSLQECDYLSAYGHHSACLEIEKDNADSFIMRWEELNELKANPLFRIESHSHRHGKNWNNMYLQLAEVENDLALSRELMKQQLNISSHHLCWPKGILTPINFIKAKELGFKVQYSTIQGENSKSTHVKKAVRRINVSQINGRELALKIKLVSTFPINHVIALAYKLKTILRLRKHLPKKLALKWLKL